MDVHVTHEGLRHPAGMGSPHCEPPGASTLSAQHGLPPGQGAKELPLWRPTRGTCRGLGPLGHLAHGLSASSQA